MTPPKSHKGSSTIGDLFPPELKGDGETAASPYANQPVGEAQEGDQIKSVYFCSAKSSAISKAGKIFLNMKVSDRTGEMVARVFDGAEEIGARFIGGDFIYVEGRINSFNGQLQMIIRDATRLDPKELNPQDFLPASQKDPKAMEAALRRLIDSIEHEQLRALCVAALDDPQIGPRYMKAPAARSMHHFYLHGLLEHSLSMAMLADSVAGHFTNVDRDMLITACVFHDIGKIYEMDHDVAIDYSDAGKLIGHINIGMMIVEQLAEKIDGFPIEKKRLLEHIILSHHGTREFGSPVLPATVEAHIVHHLDNLDAKTNACLTFQEKSPVDSEWTDRHFLLQTAIRKTVKGTPPLYDFKLPGESKAKK
jgi:3'-5' exoribonuclease